MTPRTKSVRVQHWTYAHTHTHTRCRASDYMIMASVWEYKIFTSNSFTALVLRRSILYSIWNGYFFRVVYGIYIFMTHQLFDCIFRCTKINVPKAFVTTMMIMLIVMISMVLSDYGVINKMRQQTSIYFGMCGFMRVR